MEFYFQWPTKKCTFHFTVHRTETYPTMHAPLGGAGKHQRLRSKSRSILNIRGRGESSESVHFTVGTPVADTDSAGSGSVFIQVNVIIIYPSHACTIPLIGYACLGMLHTFQFLYFASYVCMHPSEIWLEGPWSTIDFVPQVHVNISIDWIFCLSDDDWYDINDDTNDTNYTSWWYQLVVTSEIILLPF